MKSLGKFLFVLLFFVAFFSLGAATVIRLTTQVTGTLPLANGGTNKTIGLASETYYAWCAGTIGTSNATAYILPPQGAALISCNATGVAEMPMPFACTAKNMYVLAQTGGAVSGSGVTALYKNNVATALTCTLGTGTSCNDTSHTASFAQGDLWSIRVTTGQASDTTAGPRALFQCQ